MIYEGNMIIQDLRYPGLYNRLSQDPSHQSASEALQSTQKLDEACTKILRESEYAELLRQLYIQLSEGGEFDICVTNYRKALMDCLNEQLAFEKDFIRERKQFVGKDGRLQPLETAEQRAAYLRGIEAKFLAEIKPYFDTTPEQSTAAHYVTLAKGIEDRARSLRDQAEKLFEAKINVNMDFDHYVRVYSAKVFSIITAKTFSDSPFLKACATGDLSTVQTTIAAAKKTGLAPLYEQKEDEIDGQADVYHAIHLAVLFRHLDVLDILLNNDYPVNQRSMMGATALHIACKIGDIDLVKRLLKRTDIKVNEKGPENRTALHYAAYNGHAAIVHLLLAHGADVLALDTSKQTPLHDAMRRPIPWDLKAQQLTGPVNTALVQQEDVVSLLVAVAKAQGKLTSLLSQKTTEQKTVFDYAFLFQQPTLLPLLGRPLEPFNPGNPAHEASLNLNQQEALILNLRQSQESKKEGWFEMMCETIGIDMGTISNDSSDYEQREKEDQALLQQFRAEYAPPKAKLVVLTPA